MNTDTNKSPQLPQNVVKCRFFAQFYGQKVLMNNILTLQCKHLISDDFDKYWLTLNRLSKITDEDAIEVAKIFGMTEDFEFIGKMLCNGMFDNSESESETVLFNSNVKAVDFLRSKGYALPFMEYSVEDLISFGWVRLS